MVRRTDPLSSNSDRKVHKSSFLDRWQEPYRLPAILSIFVQIYILILLGRILCAAVQTSAWPNEFREAANVQMTRAILSGCNPYAPDSLSGAVPGVCYLYGPLVSCIAALAAKIIPVSLVSIHYGISFFAMVASAYLAAKMVWEHSRTLMAPSLAFLMTIFCHWRYGYIYGAPDSFGLFLLILVFYLVTRDIKQSPVIETSGENPEKGKTGWKETALDWLLPFLAALVTVATFFTKQYFLMIAATAAICYLFISGKRFLQYAVSGIVISGVWFAAAAKWFPLFWTYAVYMLKGPGAGAGMGKSGVAHNNLQVSYLGGMLIMLFLMVFIDFIRSAFVTRAVKMKIDLKHMNRPVIGFDVTDPECNYGNRSIPFELMFYVQMLFSALVLRYIGNNNGAFLSYYLQLFTPALVIASVCALDGLYDWTLSGKIRSYLLGREENKNMREMIIALCMLVFAGYTIWKVEPRLIINRLSAEEMRCWEEAEAILDEVPADGEIYYVPPLAYHGMNSGRYVYNSGQPFVVSDKFYKEFEHSKSAQKLFPHAGEIMEQHFAYRKTVLEKVRNGGYALVTDVQDMDVVFTPEDLALYYKKEASVPLRIGNWTYDVDFWVLKQ